MGKGQIVTFTQNLGRLGRKGRDKKVIAVGQDQDEVMGLLGHATSDHTSLSEIGLSIARRMIKRHKHFPGHPAPLSDIILDNRQTALIAVIVPQPVKYPLGRMPLLFGLSLSSVRICSMIPRNGPSLGRLAGSFRR